MIYSYKNIDVNLSKMKVTGVSGMPIVTKSQEYFCKSLNLQSSTSLKPNYLLYDKFVENYVASNGIEGSLKISYYLTGEDLIRDFFSDDLAEISGNIGGLNFNKGKVSSYSLSAKPNSPILVNAEISFFNELGGNFKPIFKEATSVDVFNYYNTSFENLSPDVLGSDVIVFNFDYSFRNQIMPVYKIDSGVGQIAPTEINIGRKESTLKLNTDKITGKMPFSGQKAAVNIGLVNFGGVLMDTIHITGIVTEKNISTSDNQIINSEITIQQANTSKNIQSVDGYEASRYGSNTLCRVSGDNLDEIYNSRIGNIFYDLVGPFRSSADFLNRYDGAEETHFTKITGPDGRTEIIILAPAFHSSGELLSLLSNGAATHINNIDWIRITPSITGASPNPQFIGSEIDIKGLDFYKIKQIFLGNSEITSFNSAGSKLITNCIIPDNAESGIIKLVTVTNSTGLGNFAFYPYPKILSLNTYTGIIGQDIEILGAAFNHVTGVRFNKALAEYTVNSNFSITATIPSGDIHGPISVSGYTGTFFTTEFDFEAVPVITGQLPATGVTGKAVRLLGTGIIPEILYSPSDDDRFLVTFYGKNATGLFNLVSGSLTGIVPRTARRGDLRITKDVSLASYDSSFYFNLSGFVFNLISTYPKTGSSSFSSEGIILSEITGVTLKNTRTDQRFIIPTGNRVGFKIIELDDTDIDDEILYNLVVNGLTGTGFQIEGTQNSGSLVEGLYNIILSDSSNLSKEFSEKDVNTFYFATKPEISGFFPLSGVIGDYINIYGTGLYDGTRVSINNPGQVNLFGISKNATSGYTSAGFLIDGNTLKDSLFSEDSPPVEFVTGFFTFKNKFSSKNATGNSSGIVPFKLIGPPYISGFIPTSGSINTTIIISGLGFINVKSLNLSNNNKSIDSFNIVGTTGINFQITKQMLESGGGGGQIIIKATGGSFMSSESLLFMSPTIIGSGFSPQPAIVGTEVILTGQNLEWVRMLSFSGLLGGQKELSLGENLDTLGKFTINYDPTFSTGEYHIKFKSPTKVSGDHLVKLTSSYGNEISYTLTTFKNDPGQIFTFSGINENGIAPTVIDSSISFTGVSGDVFAISGSGFFASNAKVFFGTGVGRLFLAPVQKIETDSLITGKMENGLNGRIFLSGFRNGLSITQEINPLILLPQILGMSKTVFVEGDCFKVTGLNTFQLSGFLTQTGDLNSRRNTNIRLAITGLRYGSSVPEVEFLNYNISGFELSAGNLNFSGQINSEFAGTGRVFLINLSDTGSLGSDIPYYITYNSGNFFKEGFTKNYLSGKILPIFNSGITIQEKQATISGFSPKVGQLDSEVIVTGTSLRAITGISLFSGSTESTPSVPYGYECLFYDVEKPINFGRIKFAVPADFTLASGRLRFLSRNYTTDTTDFFGIISSSNGSISPTGGVAGDLITLNGSTFNSVSQVSFISLDNEIVSGKFTIVNDTQITVTVPDEGRLTAPQVASIKIKNSDGSINLGNFDVRQGSEKFYGNIQATGFISGSNFLGTGLGGRPTVNGSGVLLVGEATAGGGGNITITGGLDTSSASQIFTGDGVQVLFGLNSGIHTGINGSTDQIRAASVLVSLDGLLQHPVQHYTITTHLVGVAYSGLLFTSAPVTGTEIEVRRFGDTVTVDFTGGGGGGGGISTNQAIIYALIFG